jgi:predicted ATP-binding protein involved in virulence
MTPEIKGLVNEYCELSERIKKDEKRLKEIRKVVLAHATIAKPLKTEQWCITYTETDADTLDVKKIRKDMSASWIKLYTVTSTRVTLKVTKL